MIKIIAQEYNKETENYSWNCTTVLHKPKGDRKCGCIWHSH